MQDAIIKGIGNSRYLKTVGEALSLYPTYEDFLQAMIAGTFPVDFNGINKDGWTQQGTPLNKANLLSDTVISTLGLSTGVNSTPNDAFNVLANIGNVHVWRKTVVTEEEIPAGYNLGESQSASIFGAAANYYYADSVSVSDSGFVSLVSPSEQVISASQSYVGVLEGFRGKFFYYNPNNIYYMDPSCEVTYPGGTNFTFSALKQVIGYPATPPGTHVTYLTSTNRNAYQDGTDGSEKPAGYTLGSKITGNIALTDRTNESSTIYWNYSDQVDVSDDGEVSLIAPNRVDFNATQSNAVNMAKYLLGKFIMTDFSNTDFSANTVYFIPNDASVLREPSGTRYVYTSKYQTVTGYPATPAGTTIEYLGVLGEKSQVQVISYVGTGTYGEANPCSVTANFPIKALFSLGYGGTFGFDPPYTSVKNGPWGDKETGIMISEFLTTTFVEHMGFIGSTDTSIIFGKKSEDGKTFYWYTPGKSSAGQLNSSGYSYYFLALG